MNTYKIRRFYRDHPAETIKTGLTLEEAQQHCDDPETSSQTCSLPENVALTARRGPWFDGYDEE
jgi:hypothetical protein